MRIVLLTDIVLSEIVNVGFIYETKNTLFE